MTMDAITIRPESPPDVEGVRAVHCDAFPTNAEADLVDRLRDNGQLSVSLVATIDETIVGHIAFSPVQCEATGAVGMGLAPVAVQSSHQRRGIGGRLVEAGLDICREQEIEYAVVLGDPAYYGRFGFIPAQQFGVKCEYTEGDAFQVIELRDGALKRITGLIRYADEFNAK